MKQLQDNMRVLLNEVDQLHAACDDKDELNAKNLAYIAKLEAHIAELEARPTNVYADNYIEKLEAKKVLLPQQRHLGKRSKKNIEDSNQLFLELWKNNQTAIS